MKRGFKFYLRQVLKYFLQGLLYTVPIAVIAYVLITLLRVIDGFIPSDIPGLGVLMVILLVTAAGFLGNTILATPLKYYINKLFDRAPLLKTVYSAIRDLLSAFVGDKKKFNKPVLVRLTKDSELYKFGFITNTDMEFLGIENGKVAVYLPHSYNFSGNLFVVPREHVTPIDASSADVMKFIISGGITKPDKEKETITS